MTLEQLEVVLAIVDHGSFRAAAEKLNRSQPALSAAVKNLEDEFDLQIFDRSTYRPQLTEAGQTFLKAARTTLQASQQTIRLAKELGAKKAETKLRVSVDPLISTVIIKRLAAECARPVVPVTLILETSILDSSAERLLSGKVDLAIAPCSRDDDRIEAIPLESVTMVGAISKACLPKNRKPTRDDLAANTQVFAYDTNPDDETPNQNSQSLRRIFVPDHATKLKLIEAGAGWGRISMSEFKKAKGLIMMDRALLSPITLELCLMRARAKPLGPTGRSIWTSFQKQASS